MLLLLTLFLLRTGMALLKRRAESDAKTPARGRIQGYLQRAIDS